MDAITSKLLYQQNLGYPSKFSCVPLEVLVHRLQKSWIKKSVFRPRKTLDAISKNELLISSKLRWENLCCTSFCKIEQKHIKENDQDMPLAETKQNKTKFTYLFYIYICRLCVCVCVCVINNTRINYFHK